MTFQTDTSWPRGLQTIFDHGRAKRSTFEDRYYGPYDKLLNYCFGDDFNFYLARQVPLADDRQDGGDLRIPFFTVFDRNDKPVLLVEIRDDGWAQKPELRYRADKLMRDRYALMLDDCSFSRLYGLSILGTSMRVYCGVKASYEIVPPPIPRPEPPSRDLLPSFLAEEWDLDILSQIGFEKMKEIVADILSETGR